MRRLLLAAGLFVLAPLVAEFLLGNLPITALSALVLLAPLYGGGALLIREAVRRTGRGWPSILILALAYGVLEEGIATMSLFNPNYVGLRLLDHGYVPWLGIGLSWTVLVLTLHVVWSIAVPIAIVETLAGDLRTTPWLGRPGLALTAVLFVAGVAGMAWISVTQSQFVASTPQLAASGSIAAGLAAVGLIAVRPQAGQRPRPAGPPAPSPWLVGTAAFVVSSAFKLLPISWSPWLYLALALGLALLAIVGVIAWSRRRGWGDAHRLALAAGPLLTYAWTAFPQPPVLPATPTEDLIGNGVFAIAAIALIGVAALRGRRQPPRASDATRTDNAELAAPERPASRERVGARPGA
jgi:hypothetical protein